MYILGLNAFIHDSAAALFRDGELVVAVEEERLSRIKHTADFPARAVRLCCEEAGIGPGDIDHVAFFWQPWRGLGRRAWSALDTWRKKGGAQTPTLEGEECDPTGPRVLWDMATVPRHLARALGVPRRRLRARFHYVPHHVAHAASCFLASPFERAAILSVDDRGEVETTWLGAGAENTIRRVDQVRFPHSLGAIYSMMTQFLGFRKDCDEGKVMGLSAYGEPRYLPTLRRVLRLLPDGRFAVDTAYVNYPQDTTTYFDERLERLLGPARQPDEPLTDRHNDLAASVQVLLEEALLHVARRLHRITGESAICLSGGVALNSVANGRLRREGPFEDLFVQPAAGDAGTAIGAALYVWHGVLGQPRRWRMDHAYTGPAFDTARCRAAAEASGLPFRREDDIVATTAGLLAEGKVVGWLTGRMEYGPRALGHRSILAAPHDAAMRDTVNAKVKFREWFRPFAPAVCQEDAGRYFDAAAPSPFMLEVHDVRPAWRDRLAAITHVDGTARLQTVGADTAPRFWSLLRAYGERSGVPVLLNTSFNVAGEPIVCTPEEAVASLRKSALDHVVVEDVLVSRPDDGGP